MFFQTALQNLGVTDYTFEGDDPTTEDEFLAGFRMVEDGEEIQPDTPPVAWVDIEAQIAPMVITEAREQIDAKHAEFLRLLTGNSSIEERDTWKLKQEAASAHLAGTATPVQTQTLSLEAEAKGLALDDLANVIVQRADAFSLLVGMASAIKAKAGVQLGAIADLGLGLAETKVSVAALFDALETEVGAAVAQWHEQTDA